MACNLSKVWSFYFLPLFLFLVRPLLFFGFYLERSYLTSREDFF